MKILGHFVDTDMSNFIVVIARLFLDLGVRTGYGD
jgi:hypothetical protein